MPKMKVSVQIQSKNYACICRSLQTILWNFCQTKLCKTVVSLKLIEPSINIIHELTHRIGPALSLIYLSPSCSVSILGNIDRICASAATIASRHRLTFFLLCSELILTIYKHLYSLTLLKKIARWKSQFSASARESFATLSNSILLFS